MRMRWSFLGLILVVAGGLLSCSSGTVGGGSGGGAVGTGNVAVMMGDTPPDGVTVLTFEVSLTGAVLQPGNVSLVNTPIRIELKQLEVELAFLNAVQVPAGTYTSIQLTFANPELTFLNSTGATLAGCPNGQVCKIDPPLNPVTVNFSGPPFPLTIAANSSLGLLVDFDLQNSLSQTLSVAPVISIVTLPAVQGTGQIEEIEDVFGRVVSVDAANNRFTLDLTLSGQQLVVVVDAQTEFEDFDDDGLCPPNNFSCIQVGQVLEVDLRILAGGVLRARKVEFEDGPNAEEVEGIIVAIQSTTQFQIVVLNEVPNLADIEVGNLINVTVQSGANFQIDPNGLTIPADLRFESGADLLVGQTVQVRRRSGSSGTNINTDRVRLRRTRFTASVQTAGAQTFQVNQLPALFTANGITSIEVRTSAETDFDNVSGAAALIAGDRVSLRGLLFRRTGGIPVLVAKKVRKR